MQPSIIDTTSRLYDESIPSAARTCYPLPASSIKSSEANSIQTSHAFQSLSRRQDADMNCIGTKNDSAQPIHTSIKYPIKQGINSRRQLQFVDSMHIDYSIPPRPADITQWRMLERMKTMDVALVLCLNIGTDPPDVIKSSPCARKECWVDPFSMPAQKALETIGKTLQSQYERWQPRARYRQSLDPTVEETKQLCTLLRKHAKKDRVLFHYNGHGVPRPTANGEVWVFNRSYTQYIPLLLYDVQTWLETPVIYVFDCSNAGILLAHFAGSSSDSKETCSAAAESIVLAACASDELLPMNPELCADVFTSCLTTPITVALRWFIAQNELSMGNLDMHFIDRIPGKLNDRKTPLGELNWIFTAVTDTIAWNVLPQPLFQKLFRQDLLLASLFRNFLLAERIMKSAGCTPCSLPALPATNFHSLWRSWDLAVEGCLSQLYRLANPSPCLDRALHSTSEANMIEPSRFFAEQLTAFERWLEFGSAVKDPPQQLPMVLQVLLSQVHRLRALVLLKQFLDLGPWAVNLALSVGIFPYVLKLLQSPAGELRQMLVFIWVKILALDPSCQADIVKDDGHAYFISHLALGSSKTHNSRDSTVSSEQKLMAAFVLSLICDNYPIGQQRCLSQSLHRIAAALLTDKDAQVRKWSLLCLAKLWENCEDAKRLVLHDITRQVLARLLEDEISHVRAAAAFAIGTFLSVPHDTSSNTKSDAPFDIQRSHVDISIASDLSWGCEDASALVRRECVLALSNIVLHPYHLPRFELIAQHFKNRPNSAKNEQILRDKEDYIDDALVAVLGENVKCYMKIWQTLKRVQAKDPFPAVVETVKLIVSRVNAGILAQSKGRTEVNLNRKHLIDATVTLRQMENIPKDMGSDATVLQAPLENPSSAEAQRQVPIDNASKQVGFMRRSQSVGNFKDLKEMEEADAICTAVEAVHESDANRTRPMCPLSAHSRHSRSEINLAQKELLERQAQLLGHLSSSNYEERSKCILKLQSHFFQYCCTELNRPLLEDIDEDNDPLSKEGAVLLDRTRRYDCVARFARSLAPGYFAMDLSQNVSANIFEVSSDSSSMTEGSSVYNGSDAYFTDLNNGYSLTKNHQPLAYGDRDEIKKFSFSLRQRAVLNNEAEMTSLLLFHPYESLLIVADDKDQISVYNVEENEQKLKSFSNKNPQGSRLTCLIWINEDEESLLSCGSDDGVIKIYHGLHTPYMTSASPKLLTAFHAVPDLIPGTRGSGLITTWQQNAGMLFAGGNSKFLRGWNLEYEKCTISFPTCTDSCITSMDTDETASNIIVAGFGDGRLRLYDPRCRLEIALRMTMHEHTSWVVQTHLYKGRNEMLSGSVSGELKFWDLRYPKNSTRVFEAHRSPMTALAVHDYAPIFASGSHNQFIKVFRTDGEQLALIRYHEGFLGERIGPVSCLAFHPHRLLLAAGATDSVIAIYSGDK